MSDVTQYLLAITVSYADSPQTESTETDHLAAWTDYYDEVSYGRYDLDCTYAGVCTVTKNITDTMTSILAECEATLSGTYDFDDYDYVFLFPLVLGTRCSTFTTDGSKVIRTQTDGAASLWGTLHEVGHMLRVSNDFAIGEANVLRCGSDIIASAWAAYVGDTVTWDSYDDNYDIMGGQVSGFFTAIGHLNAAYKDALGFFSGSEIQEITEAGTYVLTPYETVGGGYKAFKIRRGYDQWLYVEWRTENGYDAAFADLEETFPGISDVYLGALIHVTWPGTGDAGLGSSGLLDPDPPHTANSGAIGLQWEPGSTFTDPVTGATIEVVSRTGTTLTLDIDPGTPDITIPTISNVTPAQYAAVSGTIELDVTASAGTYVVTMSVGGTTVKEESPFAFTVDTTDLTDGYNAFTFYAYDEVSNKSTVYVRVLDVQNYTRKPADSIDLTDQITKTITRSFADTLALSDQRVREIDVVLADGITLSDDFFTGSILTQALSDTVGLSDHVVRKTTVPLHDSITVADARTKGTTIVFSDTVTLSEGLLPSPLSLNTFALALSDTITLSEAIPARQVALVLGDTLSTFDNQARGGESRALQLGVPVSDHQGNRFVYAGIYGGGYIERLEHGNNMDGAAIEHILWLGDRPLTQSVMYETELTYVKVVGKTNASASDVEVTHYLNGDLTGTPVTEFSQNVAAKRVYRYKIGTLAGLKGALHSLKMDISTDDVPCGFEPLMVGMMANVVRLDKDAT